MTGTGSGTSGTNTGATGSTDLMTNQMSTLLAMLRAAKADDMDALEVAEARATKNKERMKRRDNAREAARRDTGGGGRDGGEQGGGNGDRGAGGNGAVPTDSESSSGSDRDHDRDRELHVHDNVGLGERMEDMPRIEERGREAMAEATATATAAAAAASAVDAGGRGRGGSGSGSGEEDEGSLGGIPGEEGWEEEDDSRDITRTGDSTDLTRATYETPAQEGEEQQQQDGAENDSRGQNDDHHGAAAAAPEQQQQQDEDGGGEQQDRQARAQKAAATRTASLSHTYNLSQNGKEWAHQQRTAAATRTASLSHTYNISQNGKEFGMTLPLGTATDSMSTLSLGQSGGGGTSGNDNDKGGGGGGDEYDGHGSAGLEVPLKPPASSSRDKRKDAYSYRRRSDEGKYGSLHREATRQMKREGRGGSGRRSSVQHHAGSGGGGGGGGSRRRSYLDEPLQPHRRSEREPEEPQPQPQEDYSDHPNSPYQERGGGGSGVGRSEGEDTWGETDANKYLHQGQQQEGAEKQRRPRDTKRRKSEDFDDDDDLSHHTREEMGPPIGDDDERAYYEQQQQREEAEQQRQEQKRLEQKRLERREERKEAASSNVDADIQSRVLRQLENDDMDDQEYLNDEEEDDEEYYDSDESSEISDITSPTFATYQDPPTVCDDGSIVSKGAPRYGPGSRFAGKTAAQVAALANRAVNQRHRADGKSVSSEDEKSLDLERRLMMDGQDGHGIEDEEPSSSAKRDKHPSMDDRPPPPSLAGDLLPPSMKSLISSEPEKQQALQQQQQQQQQEIDEKEKAEAEAAIAAAQRQREEDERIEAEKRRKAEQEEEALKKADQEARDRARARQQQRRERQRREMREKQEQRKQEELLAAQMQAVVDSEEREKEQQQKQKQRQSHAAPEKDAPVKSSLRAGRSASLPYPARRSQRPQPNMASPPPPQQQQQRPARRRTNTGPHQPGAKPLQRPENARRSMSAPGPPQQQLQRRISRRPDPKLAAASAVGRAGGKGALPSPRDEHSNYFPSAEKSSRSGSSSDRSGRSGERGGIRRFSEMGSLLKAKAKFKAGRSSSTHDSSSISTGVVSARTAKASGGGHTKRKSKEANSTLSQKGLLDTASTSSTYHARKPIKNGQRERPSTSRNEKGGPWAESAAWKQPIREEDVEENLNPNNVDVEALMSTMGKDIDFIFRELSVFEEEQRKKQHQKQQKSAANGLPSTPEDDTDSDEGSLIATAKIKYTLGSLATTLKKEDKGSGGRRRRERRANQQSDMRNSQSLPVLPTTDPVPSNAASKSADPLLIDEDGFIISPSPSEPTIDDTFGTPELGDGGPDDEDTDPDARLTSRKAKDMVSAATSRDKKVAPGQSARPSRKGGAPDEQGSDLMAAKRRELQGYQDKQRVRQSVLRRKGDEEDSLLGGQTLATADPDKVEADVANKVMALAAGKTMNVRGSTSRAAAKKNEGDDEMSTGFIPTSVPDLDKGERNFSTVDYDEDDDDDISKIDAVEAATKKRIEMLRRVVAEKAVQLSAVDNKPGRGGGRTGDDAELNTKLDFVEQETMKQISRLRKRYSTRNLDVK